MENNIQSYDIKLMERHFQRGKRWIKYDTNMDRKKKLKGLTKEWSKNEITLPIPVNVLQHLLQRASPITQACLILKIAGLNDQLWFDLRGGNSEWDKWWCEWLMKYSKQFEKWIQLFPYFDILNIKHLFESKSLKHISKSENQVKLILTKFIENPKFEGLSFEKSLQAIKTKKDDLLKNEISSSLNTMFSAYQLAAIITQLDRWWCKDRTPLTSFQKTLERIQTLPDLLIFENGVDPTNNNPLYKQELISSDPLTIPKDFVPEKDPFRFGLNNRKNYSSFLTDQNSNIKAIITNDAEFFQSEVKETIHAHYKGAFPYFNIGLVKFESKKLFSENNYSYKSNTNYIRSFFHSNGTYIGSKNTVSSSMKKYIPHLIIPYLPDNSMQYLSQKQFKWFIQTAYNVLLLCMNPFYDKYMEPQSEELKQNNQKWIDSVTPMIVGPWDGRRILPNVASSIGMVLKFESKSYYTDYMTILNAEQELLFGIRTKYELSHFSIYLTDIYSFTLIKTSREVPANLSVLMPSWLFDSIFFKFETLMEQPYLEAELRKMYTKNIQPELTMYQYDRIPSMIKTLMHWKYLIKDLDLPTIPLNWWLKTEPFKIFLSNLSSEREIRFQEFYTLFIDNLLKFEEKCQNDIFEFKAKFNKHVIK